MIAPCGLDCSLCSEALKKENPCAGCMGSDDNKPEYCSQRCTIINCKNFTENNYRFCSECSEYPCEFSMEREMRYMTQYIMRESPLTNLKNIQKLGMDEFLIKQSEEWTCKICGGVICVHTGLCSRCENQYNKEDVKV